MTIERKANGVSGDDWSGQNWSRGRERIKGGGSLEEMGLFAKWEE
jgi:hypothetical protein